MTTAPFATAQASPFGARLRQWRRARGLSQLALAAQAGSTSRHVSFLETGRSRPSREMVLRLADVLELPLRDCNQLLQAAGLAPAYREAGISARELAPYRRAIDRLLTAHEPFPALVLDAHAQVLAANRACATLFGGDLVGTNMIERYLSDPATREAIVNWPEVAWAAYTRLRRQLREAPLDDHLRSLVGVAETAVAGLPPPDPARHDTRHDAHDEARHSLVPCPSFRFGDTLVRTIALSARFDTPTEVCLDELRIELIYPLDVAAEDFFRRQAG